MPEPPAGEAELRALADRFSEAEARIRALIARTPTGDRRGLLGEALKILIELRRLDYKGPVIAAYLAALRAAGGGARAGTVRDLAGSLALKLDRAAQTATHSAREAFAEVTADNVEEMADAAVTAHTDARATRWTLGGWAAMNTQTIGRTATSRGVAHAIGKGHVVRVDVGECALCDALFSGDLVVGQDALPPGHPGCTCTVLA